MIWIFIGFVATDIYGNKVDFDGIVKEKHVVLNFWATWCNHCDEELDKLNKHFSDRDDIVIIAISQDTKRDIERVNSMAKSHGWKMPIVIDDGKRISSQFAVLGLPTVIIFEKGGKLKKKVFGYNPKIVEIIRETLKL